MIMSQLCVYLMKQIKERTTEAYYFSSLQFKLVKCNDGQAPILTTELTYSYQ